MYLLRDRYTHSLVVSVRSQRDFAIECRSVLTFESQTDGETTREIFHDSTRSANRLDAPQGHFKYEITNGQPTKMHSQDAFDN